MGIPCIWQARGGTLALALVAFLGCGACAARGAPPRYPGAIRSSESGSARSPLAGAVVTAALALQGQPYRNGGTGDSGFDCSGLVQFVFGQQGIALPRSVREQFQAGRDVPAADLSPGDLVFFSTVASGASHVGILVGNDLFVHAPSERGVVRTDHLSAQYWSRRYLGARRMW